MLGLPDHVTACLFDLDGVLTPTAKIHDAAWKEMFDAYLDQRTGADPSLRSRGGGADFRPFDPVADYDDFVDGKPREDGVRDFLASRHITLPLGERDDPPTAETLHGLGNRKNEILLKKIRTGGLEPYPGSVAYLEAAIAAGLRRAVVSSSANTLEVIESTGLARYLEARVDGRTIAEKHLHGKPAPDTFLIAAQELGVDPAHAAVFEDALAGVEAGRAGAFGFVVGVDRGDHADALRAHGADIVVKDLGDLL